MNEVRAKSIVKEAFLEGASQVTIPASRLVADRRRRRGVADSDRQRLQLVEKNGILTLRQTHEAARLRRAGPTRGYEILEERPLHNLDRNQVQQALDALDRRLSEPFGWYQVQRRHSDPKKADLAAVSDTSKKGLRKPRDPRAETLILVHGTFTNGHRLLQDLQDTPAGRKWLDQALDHYGGGIWVFNHATLGRSVMLNALEMASGIGQFEAPIHLLTHSRGGLVARCWLETMDCAGTNRNRRAVFIGSPLQGSSLASPPRLKATLDLMANFASGLAHTASLAALALPVMSVATTLFEVFSSVTSVVRKTPAIDAAIRLVPGLADQSRVSNNHLLNLMVAGRGRSRSNYAYVGADFESQAVGWEFWKLFKDSGTRIANFAADKVFPGQNDLVVDTVSMDPLRANGGPAARTLHFDNTRGVHHLNYFQQDELYRFLRSRHFGR